MTNYWGVWKSEDIKIFSLGKNLISKKFQVVNEILKRKLTKLNEENVKYSCKHFGQNKGRMKDV